MDKYLHDVNIPHTLSERERDLCNGMPTIDELRNVVSTMKKNKSPGSDGLPIEFYQTFWPQLQKHFYAFTVETFIVGELPTSARHGILSLIHKSGDKCQLKNYRPISLMNTDYKIIAFVLATRLQKVLPKIIDEDQSGYMKGRFIGNNIRTVLDIFDYCEILEEKGALIFLDYQKAFDSVEWTFMEKCLQKFEFGANFIRWVKILYTKPTFAVKNNGWISRKHSLSRGIRQGCPISALLFIIVVEILGIQIRNNKKVKGFTFEKKEIKISQYADDGIIMMSDYESVKEALQTVKNFSDVAGPQLNMDKVQGIWLGSYKANMPNNFAEIKWTNEPVKCLGIYIGHNTVKCNDLNWGTKIAKIRRLLEVWKLRKLTIWGKIHILKTLALPIINFSATYLRPLDVIVGELTKICKDFFGFKSKKIAYNTAVGEVEQGGSAFLTLSANLRHSKPRGLQG